LDGGDMALNPHPNRPTRASMRVPNLPRDWGLNKTWSGCKNQPTSLQGDDRPPCAFTFRNACESRWLVYLAPGLLGKTVNPDRVQIRAGGH
jgi:hypothetical protein